MKKVPELRFPEFRGEWEQKKLEEIASIKGGFAFSSKSFKKQKSEYQVVKMANLYKNRLDLDRAPSYLDKISKKVEGYELKMGDIIITLTGTVNKTDFGYSYRISKEKKLLLNQRLALIKSNSDQSSLFLINIIRNKMFLSQFFASSAGGTGNQANVSTKDMEKFVLRIPTLPEQQKIADLFSTLDSRIEIQENKIKNLEDQKKGYMQRIFSQELRFKDENGEDYPEWESKEIEAMLTIKHGKDQKKIEVESGKFPILGTGGEIGHTNTPLYSKPSVLIGRKGTINKPQYMDTPFWTVDTLFYSIIKEGYIPKYIYYLFNTINWLKYNEASGVPSLSAKTVESIKVETAQVVSEQQKIANFLSLFDEKIEIEKKILETLQEMKRGFLQKMFV